MPIPHIQTAWHLKPRAPHFSCCSSVRQLIWNTFIIRVIAEAYCLYCEFIFSEMYIVCGSKLIHFKFSILSAQNVSLAVMSISSLIRAKMCNKCSQMKLEDNDYWSFCNQNSLICAGFLFECWALYDVKIWRGLHVLSVTAVMLDSS